MSKDLVKDFILERIEKEATKRADKDIIEAIKLVESNTFLSNLTIDWVRLVWPSVKFLKTASRGTDEYTKRTNTEKIREKRIEKYIEEVITEMMWLDAKNKSLEQQNQILTDRINNAAWNKLSWNRFTKEWFRMFFRKKDNTWGISNTEQVDISELPF